MIRDPVASSNIASIGYDPDSETLEIEFTNGSILYFRPAGAYGDAIRELETYLSLAQDAQDRAYAQMYLEEARKRKDQGKEGK